MNTKLSSSAKASADKQSGQISRTLIVLAFAILLITLVVYGLLRYATTRKAQISSIDEQQSANEPPKPVYEATVGDIRFLFDSALDLGPVIKAEKLYQQDLVTTEKFIKVTIRAQNKGKADTAQFAWNIGSIVDADGRNFIEYNNAYYFLPRPDLCGAILKPEFEPTPCVKIYEVSKVSDHLKIVVNMTSPSSSKKQEAFLDLKVR